MNGVVDLGDSRRDSAKIYKYVQGQECYHPAPNRKLLTNNYEDPAIWKTFVMHLSNICILFCLPAFFVCNCLSDHNQLNNFIYERIPNDGGLINYDKNRLKLVFLNRTI